MSNTAPTAALTATPSATLHHTPQTLGAGRAIGWLFDSAALLIKYPLAFIAISMISILALYSINLIPILGNFAVALLWPVFLAGFFLAFTQAKQHQRVLIQSIFAPFKAPARLIGIGAMYLLAGFSILLLMLASAYLSTGSFSAIANGQVDIDQMSSAMMLLLLLSIPASVALAMAFTFAPVLVYQHQLPVLRAIGRSFMGSLRNILPLIIFSLLVSLCFIALGLLASTPFIGGLLSSILAMLYVPWICGALFCAYSDIFIIQPHTQP